MSRLKPAPSFHAFVEDPRGRYWLSSRYLVFAASPTLAGFVVWGRPAIEDVDDLLYMFDQPQPSTMAACGDALVDLSRVAAVSPDIFDRLLRGSLTRMDVLLARIRRQVVVRPDGMLGALFEGFTAFFRPDYGLKFVVDMAQGFAQLGVEDAAALAAEINQLADQASLGSSLIARLRGWLQSRYAHANVEEAAAALTMSTRTLQRRLEADGSSFANELSIVRVQRAQELLIETDRKIEAIGLEVGCATASGFTILFKRYSDGLTPTEFRANATRSTSKAK